jgi:hypothetical protein
MHTTLTESLIFERGKREKHNEKSVCQSEVVEKPFGKFGFSD